MEVGIVGVYFRIEVSISRGFLVFSEDVLGAVSVILVSRCYVDLRVSLFFISFEFIESKRDLLFFYFRVKVVGGFAFVSCRCSGREDIFR